MRLKTVVAVLALLLLAVASSVRPTAAAQGRKPAAPAAKAEVPAAATAVFDTTAGTLRCTLFPKEAPKTVANFIGLAEGTKDWTHPFTKSKKKGVPLFNGTIFHRVIPNFMIQGGDPAGNGTGSPGYSFEDEFVATLKFDRPGRLAMANSGPNSNGSQFFITDVPTPHLNNRHTIFGQCDEASLVLVRKIARAPRDQRTDKPFTPVKINKITIERGAAKPVAARPAAKPAAAPAKQ